MVFVHARNATVKTAMTLREMAQQSGEYKVNLHNVYKYCKYSKIPLLLKKSLTSNIKVVLLK